MTESKNHRFRVRPALWLWGAGLLLGVVSGSLVAAGLANQL
ncbi:hypothetical protein [Sandarakinorhabdus glacialis]|nr:hypothetical protein [Polymorphobacter glacialis]